MQQKNNQIVENIYKSKIMRHLNKIESRIKQNPKNNNKPTDKRIRTQTQKTRKPPTPQKTITKFSETAQFSPQKRPQKL